jgi:hypothetical protein
MKQLESYRLIWSVAKNIHRSQAKMLVAMVIGLVDAGKMKSFDIAHALADRFSVKFKSAILRFYRFVKNRSLAGYLAPVGVRHHDCFDISKNSAGVMSRQEMPACARSVFFRDSRSASPVLQSIHPPPRTRSPS